MFKKVLAMLMALTLVMSLSAISLPVSAEDAEDPSVDVSVDIYEAVRINTNLFKDANPGLEKGAVDEAPEGIWANANNQNKVSVAVKTTQAYNGNNSLLNEYKGAGRVARAYAPIVYSAALKANTTYIGSVMAIGTEANRSNPEVTASDLFYLRAVTDGSVTRLTEYGKVPIKDLPQAPASTDATQETVDKSDWTMFYNAVTFSNTPGYLGFGLYSQVPGTEVYTDDYYMGELIVANVDVTADKNKVVVSAISGETVTLDATAYNQLGNTNYLAVSEDKPVTYDYTVVSAPAGVTVSDAGVITVPADTKAGKIQVKVTANPTFLGADAQTDATVLALREKVVEIDVEVEEIDIYEAIRNQTNLFKDANPGLEKGTVGEEPTGIWANANNSEKVSVAVATTQAYNGNNSLLNEYKGTSRAARAYAPIVYSAALKANTTYIGSVMAIGTEANSSNSQATASDLFYLRAVTNGSVTRLTEYGKLPIKDFAQAPASTEATQEKVEKSDWTMFYNAVTFSSVPDYLGFGLYSQVPGTEVYTDDYYMGELIVANVDVTADKNKVVVSAIEGETVALDATAYNQLGNTNYLALNEEAPYSYAIVTAPAGVTVSDAGVITVPAGTRAGKIQVKVTANPTFLGADAQTDATVLALREKVVEIDVEELAGFRFDNSNNSITATAVVGTLAGNAKAYCALYKVEGGVKKLMNVEAKSVVAGGENVNFTAIATPNYTYEIKCFMWYEGTMNNVIPAVTYPQN